MTKLVRYDAAAIDGKLPALMERVRGLLDAPLNADDLIEARSLSSALLAYCKQNKEANEIHAGCLGMIVDAEIKLADAIDAGQANGAVARLGTNQADGLGVQTADTRPATFAEIGVSRQRVAEWRRLRDAGRATIERAICEALAEDRAPTRADILRAITPYHRSAFTGENEWYTPAEYVELVRVCLGEIDLDPASLEEAQRTVRARHYFTAEEDGLQQEWRGRVWLNPPYAQPLIAQFMDKLLVEVDAGRTTEAIALTHNYTDTAWFQAAAICCDAICFTRGRIRFVNSAGGLAAPTQGQAFFYFGRRLQAFHAAFGGLGFIR